MYVHTREIQFPHVMKRVVKSSNRNYQRPCVEETKGRRKCQWKINSHLRWKFPKFQHPSQISHKCPQIYKFTNLQIYTSLWWWLDALHWKVGPVFFLRASGKIHPKYTPGLTIKLKEAKRSEAKRSLFLLFPFSAIKNCDIRKLLSEFGAFLFWPLIW